MDGSAKRRFIVVSVNSARKIILASSSKYRQNLLSRLQLGFESIAPDTDESIKKNEQPQNFVKRVSLDKAYKIAEEYIDAVVIGSDQIAVFNDQIIGKPGTHQNAFQQLKSFSGNKIDFLTGVAVIIHSKQVEKYRLSKVTVKFKALTEQQIENYLLVDKPYDCAGSFKVESLGISLFESIQSDDPTSLEGLPLITVCNLLAELDIETG